MLRHELKILGKNGARSRQARWCVLKRRPHLERRIPLCSSENPQ
jgi:hypothetical protein